MPRFTLVGLVLVELAAAAVAGGYAVSHAWLIAGAAVAVVLLALALVPVRRRWLHQVIVSWLGLAVRRRRLRRGVGLSALLGEYEVVAVPGGSHGASIGAVRSGATWCVPLMLDLDGVLNDDAPVPLQSLADLLQIEDVPLASVRLLTLTSPAQVSSQIPPGPVAPLVPLAARYVLLTLDSGVASAAIADRGGTEAAIHQILRRCEIHTRQALSTAGVPCRRMNPDAVASLFATWMGPASAPAGRQADRPVESWGDVSVSGTWSTGFAVSGQGDDLVDRALKLVASAPTPVAVTTLLLRRAGRSNALDVMLLVRLSSPETMPHDRLADGLDPLAQAYGLRLQRLDGEQGALLRATAPVGVGALT